MGKHGKKSKKGSHEAANPPAISESKNNQSETVNQQIAEVSTDQRMCDASVNQQIAEISTDQRICDVSVNQQTVDVLANQTIVSANPSSVNVSTNQTTVDHSNEATSLSETNLCALCGLMTGDWIVQCDDCAKWYHFKCVDLESIGEHDPWSCLGCLQRKFDEAWDAPHSRKRNVEVMITDHGDPIESVHDKSVSGEIRSNDQTMSNPETEINLPRQSQSKPSEIDSGTVINASGIQSDVSIITAKSQTNRFSSHFNQLEKTKTSTMLADSRQTSEFMVPIDVNRPMSSMLERIRLGNSSIETQQTMMNAESSRSINEGRLNGNGSTLSQPVPNENRRQNPERSDRNIQDSNFPNVGNINPTPSIKSHRSSSKTVSSASSRKSRADLEQMRLQEQLKLQEKIDEERIKLEMKALELKAAREKKFLEEKYRAMESNDNGSSDTASHASMKKSDRNKTNASQLSNKTELVSAWVQGQAQQQSKFTPLTNIRVRKFNDKIDKFNFDYSISVNDDELREIKKMRSKEQEARSGGLLNNNEEAESFHYNPETSSKLINESGKVSTPHPSRRFMRDNTNNNIISEKQSDIQQPSNQRDCQSPVNQNPQPNSNNFQNITAPPPYQESQGNNRHQYEQNQGYIHPQPRFSHQPIPTSASQNFRSTHQQPNQSSQSIPILSQQSSGTAIPQNQQNPSNQSYQRGFGFINQHQHQPILTSSQQSGGPTFPVNQCQQPQNSFGIVPSNQAASSAYQLEQTQRPPLTANQIAARHVVVKKLPYFYGNPAEWPEFIQKYSNTTAACGFDNTENSDRLTECLKGKAKTLVKAQLSIPECVPSIIETLTQKYGRKEIVVKAVLKDIRAEPPIKPDKLETLSDFGYKVQNACKVIIKQEMHFYLFNPELIQELVDKLPHQIKIDWARYSDPLPEVTLATLSDWLVTLSRSINRITIPEITTDYGDRKSDHRSGNSKGAYVNAHEINKSSRPGEKCLLCSKSCKGLSDCYKFKGLSVEDKWKFVYDHNNICRGCLKPHGRKCALLKDCGVNGCTFKHHPMLHNDKKHVKDKSSAKSSTEVAKPTTGASRPDGTCNAHRGGQSVLYKILPVTLKFGRKSIVTFAYMDDGSGLTLLESELAQELGLKGVPDSLCLRWTSGTIRHEKDSMRVSLEVSGVEEGQQSYQMNDVRTVNLLDLPMQKINRQSLIKKYSYLERVNFRDFEAKPRILIGLDNIKLGLSREHVEGGWREPVISKTLLGWVVHGPNGPFSSAESPHMQHHVLSIGCHECPCQENKDQQFHKQIEEFFSLENFGTRALTSSVESKEIQRARKIMEETTFRKNGRFETGLLWKYDDIAFPNNYQMAMKRLECQEKKLLSDPKLMENINNQIKAFMAKGYIRKLSQREIHTEDQRITYLPLFHHLDPKKPGKVRMVWDAAAKYKGVSLNSMLLTGPDEFVALPDVLRRFREKCIAISGDIEEMYHQVVVRKQDQNSQRFLWRNVKTEVVPDVYVMQVLTFGSTCSPSLAQYVKNRNATDFEDEYPAAADAIKKNHYIDDWLDGRDTVEETIKLAKDVRFVHLQGGFKLRKFISNSPMVLEALGENREQQPKDLNVNRTSGTQRVLGMWWDTQNDCFIYSLKFTKMNEEVLLGLRAPTKRELLKTLMSIFDPLGLIAFFLVYIKILLQDIWKAQIGWDEPLPKDLNEKWNKWIQLLPSVEEIRIPRWYSSKLSSASPKSIELHMFVDAGEKAYCAVCYLRIVDSDGVECVLVEAKTKVAPIKPLLTIPRLELLAAVLGTRLAKSVGDSLSIPIGKRQFWSDSRDVLCWIRCINRKYRQFVAFRVGEILETSKESEWRFVPGKLNVADEGTKWPKHPKLDQNSRWYKGPEFLLEDPKVWPKDLSREETTNEEIHVHFQLSKTDPPSNIIPERFSRWSRMVNAQALSTRYLNKLIGKIRNESFSGPLKLNELKEAECTLYKLAQFDCFFEEITTLKNMKEKFGDKAYVKKSSSIYKCSPYLAEDGLLRIRGRIDNISHVKFDTKRPIILPKNHTITKLVVESYHRMFLHQNKATIMNELRQKYHIPRLRVVLRRVISECQICKNKRSKPNVPEMGDLPVARLSPGFRPFTFTGVDYFGPMYVTVNRGVQKRWGVLFTCLTVRAIHIEIAPSLDTDSCILCIRNFVNTRGTPAEFYSDNGTNMKSTDKVLREEFEKIDKEIIESQFTRTYSKWNFNPPASPHMAGAWERLIGLVKINLDQIMPTRTLREEQLRSYLLEVVNIVNSRPLTYLEIESDDDEALTPNHFLLGSSNGIMAPGEFLYEEKTLTKSWRRCQELTNVFWRRWIKEYLPTLTRRSKWFPKAKPIEVGDVVLLVDEKNARNSYPRGIVLEVMPDKTGQVRQALVKTTVVIPGKIGQTKDANVRISTKIRPVAKLAVLDVAGKFVEEVVKPVEVSATKCLTKGENVTNNNSNNLTDFMSNPESNLANIGVSGKRKSDRRKPLLAKRRSKRLAAKSKFIA